MKPEIPIKIFGIDFDKSGKMEYIFIYWIFPVVLKKTADQSSDLYDKTCNSYQSLKDPNAGRARDDCASTPEEIPAARSVFSLSDGGVKAFRSTENGAFSALFPTFPARSTHRQVS